MAENKSKLSKDEEAITSADEPMGSVAAAVPRDAGSSAAELKKTESQKPEKELKPARP